MPILYFFLMAGISSAYIDKILYYLVDFYSFSIAYFFLIAGISEERRSIRASSRKIKDAGLATKIEKLPSDMIRD